VEADELRARVGSRIRELAERRKIPISDLPARAGVSRAHLFAVLRGSKSPTIDFLNRLANALECDPHELLRPPRTPAKGK
jgi:transcriptional regulator with XRE-family HTH domain